MKPAIINGKCRLIGHCNTCREDAEWRALVGTPDICPHDDGLGSLVERLLAPISKRLGLKCHDEQGRLKPGTPCHQRRQKLNALTASLKKDK